LLRQEDWVLEQIDYQFLDQEDVQATAPSTAARSSRFLNALSVEAPSVPLRPLFEELHDVRWLMSETEAAAVLVTVALDLPEIGVRGEAVVTGVEPCPAILPGPGKVVLTTFHHASSDLIDLYLSPQPPTGSLTAQQSAVDALLYPQVSRVSVVDQAWERIGVTGNHPIWSEDRHDYVAAMDLRVGERLKNLSGDTVWVQQKLPRPGPTPVYNLEVQDEHVYYVGANGVLAHNAGKDNDKCGSEISLGYQELVRIKGHQYSHVPTQGGSIVNRLDEFALEVGAPNYFQWQNKTARTMMGNVRNAARDAHVIHFNLDGFRNKGSSIWDAVQAGATSGGRRTQQELYYVLSNSEIRGKTKFYRGGKLIANPRKFFGRAWNPR